MRQPPLKLVAAATQELFNGRIVEVLNYVQQGLAVFDDIRDCSSDSLIACLRLSRK